MLTLERIDEGSALVRGRGSHRASCSTDEAEIAPRMRKFTVFGLLPGQATRRPWRQIWS
jgi:hypothetical protein